MASLVELRIMKEAIVRRMLACWLMFNYMSVIGGGGVYAGFALAPDLDTSCFAVHLNTRPHMSSVGVASCVFVLSL